MPKPTSVEGKWVRLEFPNETLIYDYDIDGAQLKSRHKEGLDGVAAQVMGASGKCIIWMQGSADKTGDSGHNDALSKQRVLIAQSYLRGLPGLMAKAEFNPPDWRGDSQAPPTGYDERSRSVTIVVNNGPKPRKPNIFPTGPLVLPKVVPNSDTPCVKAAELPVSTEFDARIESSVTLPGGGSLIWFLIRDTKNHLQIRYQFVGGASNLGIGSSKTSGSAWYPFRTARDTKVNDFTKAKVEVTPARLRPIRPPGLDPNDLNPRKLIFPPSPPPITTLVLNAAPGGASLEVRISPFDFIFKHADEFIAIVIDGRVVPVTLCQDTLGATKY